MASATPDLRLPSQPQGIIIIIIIIISNLYSAYYKKKNIGATIKNITIKITIKPSNWAKRNKLA